MKKVYIISKYRGKNTLDRLFNVDVARYFCKKVIEDGNIPVALHLFYPQFLDDDVPNERAIGLELGLRALKEADEFLLVMIDGEISEGMRGEIQVAIDTGVSGTIINRTRRQIYEEMKVVV